MTCDALRRGRHSLHHQVCCITTITRGRHPLFTDITAACLLVREWSNEFDPTGLIEQGRIHTTSNLAIRRNSSRLN